VGMHNSPTYSQGVTDGMNDRHRVSDGKDPIGPLPPYPDHPIMYLRGYRAGFGPGPAIPVPADEPGDAAAYDVDMNPITT